MQNGMLFLHPEQTSSVSARMTLQYGQPDVVSSSSDLSGFLQTASRVATHLENTETSGNLRVVREKSEKVYSCIWSSTVSIDLDTKCAKKGIIY